MDSQNSKAGMERHTEAKRTSSWVNVYVINVAGISTQNIWKSSTRGSY